MTIICAIHNDGQTWIGGDSLATTGGIRMPSVIEKWVISGRVAIGVSGDIRTLGLVRRLTKLPLNALKIAEIMRKAVISDGYINSSKGGASCYELSCIIALPDGVWDVDAAFDACRITDDCLWARGSGRDFALGADFCTGSTIGPELRVQNALGAAIYYDTSCGNDLFVKRIA